MTAMVHIDADSYMDDFKTVIVDPASSNVMNELYVRLESPDSMPRTKQKWTSIVVPESFLNRLKCLQGNSEEAYWKFLSRVLDDYQTLYRQNVQLNAKFFGEPPIEEIMRKEIPPVARGLKTWMTMKPYT